MPKTAVKKAQRLQQTGRHLTTPTAHGRRCRRWARWKLVSETRPVPWTVGLPLDSPWIISPCVEAPPCLRHLTILMSRQPKCTCLPAACLRLAHAKPCLIVDTSHARNKRPESVAENARPFALVPFLSQHAPCHLPLTPFPPHPSGPEVPRKPHPLRRLALVQHALRCCLPWSAALTNLAEPLQTQKGSQEQSSPVTARGRYGRPAPACWWRWWRC